ncbi:MAG: peptidylprolyl isomerase [Desulfobacterales bacterium]|nr:peptidylprolyl isomerase [Desulfobacterales bacterium]
MQVKSNIWLWLLLFLAGGVVHVPAWAGEKNPSQDKLAVVNGSVITQAEVEREMAGAQRRLSSMGKPLDGSQLLAIKKEAIERLIERELLYQESQKKGIKVDETAVKEQLETLKKRFPAEAEFKNALSKMNLSEADVKSEFMRGMAIQRFIDKEFVQKVTVSDKGIKAYYDSNLDFFKQPEQVRASHILVSVDPKGDASQKAEARKKIEKIQQKLHKGEDFSALAKEFSQCPSSAKGGDLGYFKRGQMVKPFEEAAFALKPGEASDIVETRFGYHLIKVVDKKPKSTIAYEDVKDKLGQYLKQEEVKKEVSLYVEELKQKAKIERFLIDVLSSLR